MGDVLHDRTTGLALGVHRVQVILTDRPAIGTLHEAGLPVLLGELRDDDGLGGGHGRLLLHAAGGAPRPADALVADAAPTPITPLELLGICQRIESAAGRVRDVRWGPRTLDVDVLWIDGVDMDQPDLTVPHPRMFERRFVLAPLSEVAPDVAPEGWQLEAQGSVDRLGPL